MRIHIHLAYGFEEKTWRRRFENGLLVGINEEDPYGYRRAEAMGAQISSSRDFPENKIRKIARLGARWLLGFDIVHAFKNRDDMLKAEVIWTHTESQYLAIALIFILLHIPRNARPKLLAQSVWLIDEWPRERLRRMLWRPLISQVDLLTFHSQENKLVAQALFPKAKTELVLFGIRSDIIASPSLPRAGDPLNIIMVGNDRDRDWRTAIAAIGSEASWHLRIVSTTCPQKLAKRADNIEIRGVKNNTELFDIYGKADVALIALSPNLHASGITAMQEAALFGLPIIATLTGGLKDYFDESMVFYVEPYNATQLADAIRNLADDLEKRAALAHRAQARMGPIGLSSEAFVRRHMEISRQLVGDREPAATAIGAAST